MDRQTIWQMVSLIIANVLIVEKRAFYLALPMRHPYIIYFATLLSLIDLFRLDGIIYAATPPL